MKRILLSLLIVASLLTAFACQPGGTGGGDKVRIGVFMSLTGSTANFGISSVDGIKMAADEVNAAGGINGKQIELLVGGASSLLAELGDALVNHPNAGDSIVL